MKTNTTAKTLSTLVKRAALDAGAYIREHAFTISDFSWKYTDDPVTNLDREAEVLIREMFLAHDPTISITGEEYGITEQDGPFALYIDPIDGTKSFTRKEFKTSVSIAVGFKDGVIFSSAVYDFMRDMLFYVGIEEGPSLIVNSSGYHTLLPLQQPAYTKKFILCDEKSPYYVQLQRNPYVSVSIPTGSVALQMAQVAAGIYDGLILEPYQKHGLIDLSDIAAGYFLMDATDVKVYDATLTPFDFQKPSNGIIALRPTIKNIDELIYPNH